MGAQEVLVGWMVAWLDGWMAWGENTGWASTSSSKALSWAGEMPLFRQPQRDGPSTSRSSHAATKGGLLSLALHAQPSKVSGHQGRHLAVVSSYLKAAEAAKSG